jgi:AAA15 family ATPase/GTPase
MLATGLKENPENVFVSSNKEPEIKLLNIAVIYGANASGKSNVIRALVTMWNFVGTSTDFKMGEKIRFYDPFKLDISCTSKPTSFEVEFIGDDAIRYKYGFSYNREEISKEYLFFYPKKQEAKLFVREKGKPIDFGDGLKGAKKSIESLLLPNQLFLPKAANNNQEQLGKLFQYFKRYSVINLNNIDELNQFVANQLKLQTQNSDLSKQINNLLSYADTGISEIYLSPKENILDINSSKYTEYFGGDFVVKAAHKLYDTKEEQGSVSFLLSDESEGTQKLFALGGTIIYLFSLGTTIMVDEFDNSFHPLMSEFLIKLFYNAELNKTNSQLIFATHDTSILKPELFRRDQIWFTEKDKYGATSLYSLSEFEYDKVRANVPFDKWYLSGRFGALPLIKDFQFTKDAKTEKGE